MKTWEKYKTYLQTGEWHIHTNYTDGRNSVYDYCEKATKIGIPLVAFTEHVRKDLTYDFSSFLSDIDNAREEFNLIILSGCETKVLPGGYLDVQDDILREVDYPIFAFHSFPTDISAYMESLKIILKNKYLNTWAHPSAFLEKNNLELSEINLIRILNSMKKNKVLMEINGKYNVPPLKWIELAAVYDIDFVIGNDIHKLEDFSRNKFNLMEDV